MAQESVSPMVLVILDGWGHRDEDNGNAINNARTPVIDSLWATYPHTLIQTSGKDVGLPDGQMGNSEVGHLNIGAGRIVPQELVRISDAVENGSIQENQALLNVCQQVRYNGGKLHFIGLCSEGGVHSHLNHLLGLLDMAKSQDLQEVCIHAITDGRDTQPKAAQSAIQKLQDHIDQIGVGKIVTLSGRYYAMDRDHRWDRVEKVYSVMTEPGNGNGHTAIAAIQASYEKDVTDEFIEPVRLADGAVEPNDGVIFFNFRPDRARQLTQAFVDPEFKGFETRPITPLSFVTMTQYDGALPVQVAFEPQNLSNILGEVIADHGLKQFRTAETEKYAHVTYFFNGGREDPFEGEDRELVSSPQVATYDKAPAMSVKAVTDTAITAIGKKKYGLVVINYANPDMVGHTGNMKATIQALESVDVQLGRLLDAVGQAGGTTIIIADHGNAEYMWDEEGRPWTAHTTNPVPFILVEGERLKIPGRGGEVELRENGCLADVAPTILEILKLPQPQEMTGKSMIQPARVDVKRNRTPVKVSL
ncbi:2,3-bisphosphoglycerate-independent phosphoglycerate mutase [Leptothoe spongobia]|uniref:2,3-bisphosphoglycerate-independent phosphoglycerate mutase n=1 Tax=Leptothoe spongobia TAU-MAC 1115 TaxID=1967444 RepID=A0A947DE11_9CYAN|nr:2,3-bisphosphoglycerate-independent phosphoglycerate mutase [Leptothoe spongobia]MBT9315382.1 2,3-bisphosphoglycerate-independent phosphoglycerate mutase [Leptothoe spongobia TAU-MAC 1115]